MVTQQPTAANIADIITHLTANNLEAALAEIEKLKSKQAPTRATGLVRPKVAAKHFQVTTMTLYRWRDLDGFPQPFKRGRVVLYDIEAIEAWLAGEGV